MSNRYECHAADTADVDLILPGDQYGADEMPDGSAGVAIGEGSYWSVIIGTPDQLRAIAAKILQAVEATASLPEPPMVIRGG